MKALATKPNKTSHSGALTPPQLAAVELLALGKTDTETAEAVNVARQTVSEWRRRNPAFIAEVNRRRKELWEETHDRLRGMATRALNVLDRALDADTAAALPAAVQVLKALKVYGEVGAPSGPLTEGAVIARAAEAAARRELAEWPSRTGIMDILAEKDDLAALTQERFGELTAEWEQTGTIRDRESE